MILFVSVFSLSFILSTFWIRFRKWKNTKRSLLKTLEDLSNKPISSMRYEGAGIGKRKEQFLSVKNESWYIKYTVSEENLLMECYCSIWMGTPLFLTMKQEFGRGREIQFHDKHFSSIEKEVEKHCAKIGERKDWKEWFLEK